MSVRKKIPARELASAVQALLCKIKGTAFPAALTVRTLSVMSIWYFHRTCSKR